MKILTLSKIAVILVTSGLFLTIYLIIKHFIYEEVFKSGHYGYALLFTGLVFVVFICCIGLIITVFKDKN